MLEAKYLSIYSSHRMKLTHGCSSQGKKSGRQAERVFSLHQPDCVPVQPAVHKTQTILWTESFHYSSEIYMVCSSMYLRGILCPSLRRTRNTRNSELSVLVLYKTKSAKNLPCLIYLQLQIVQVEEGRRPNLSSKLNFQRDQDPVSGQSQI